MRILAGATKALRRIIDLGLVVLVILVVVGVALGKGVPLLGRQSIVIGGGSMEPTLGLGSAIVIHSIDPASLVAGDIVSMQVGPERTTYTHRIVAVVDRADGRWIRTQGDANAAPDPSLVPVSAVLGRVELVIPYAGYLLALLSLPIGVMFVLGLAATLLAMAWLLESLEPEPRPESRLIQAMDRPGPERRRAGSAADAAPEPVAPETGSGEPIAARPIAARPSPARPTPAPGSAALFESAWGFATPTFETPPFDAASARPAARPTVRAQLERSRDVRRRRARWELAAGQRPRALD